MCTGGESNQGPLGPKSDALSTAPLRPSLIEDDVARKYIFFQISCCNGDNIQRDSFVTIHTLISYCKLLKINLIYSYLYCLSISFEEKKINGKRQQKKINT